MSNERSDAAVLSADHVLEFGYTRTVGPVIGRFLTGLRDGRIEGVKTRAGKVLVPPQEYDPETSEAVTDEFVEVGPAGTVTSWSWVSEPRKQQPLSQPYGLALIKLDGADTAMLHAVDAGESSKMSTGMRVVPRWRDERIGMITDIECFEPEESR